MPSNLTVVISANSNTTEDGDVRELGELLNKIIVKVCAAQNSDYTIKILNDGEMLNYIGNCDCYHQLALIDDMGRFINLKQIDKIKASCLKCRKTYDVVHSKEELKKIVRTPGGVPK